MKAIIHVNGVIGIIPDENGNPIEPNTSFIDVARQVERQKGATEIEVRINSEGGFVEEGSDIYDYLISLKTKGIIVNTVALDLCASIATKIFLAGDNRIVNEHTEFMIHNPFGAPPEGDADVIEGYYKELRSIENDLISFYSSTTGTSKEAIKPLMKKETFLTPDQCVEFGFATSVFSKQPNQIFAYSNKLNTNLKTTKMSKENLDKKGAEDLLTSLLNTVKSFGKSKPKGLKIVMDANAGEIEFPDLEADDTPSVGDKTTAEDGTYQMPSGEQYVIAGGELTEIIATEEEGEGEDDELATLKAENESLKQQIADAEALKAERDALKAELKDQKKEVKELAKGLKRVQKAIGSNFSYENKKDAHDKKDGKKTRSLMKSED